MTAKDDGSAAGNMKREFAAFYEQSFGRVYNYARHRTGSAARADEIVSDTFSRAFQGWGSFDERKGDRRTWLFSIAFRAVADHYRGEKRGVWASLDSVPDPRDPEAGPAQAAEQEDEKRHLTEALAALDDEPREIVSLKFFGGLTNRAIAALTGLTESNVAVILFRAVRRMRRNFPGVEADHG